MKKLLIVLFSSSLFASAIFAADKLNITMSATHLGNAQPISYSFRTYDQNGNSSQWITVNDGNAVMKSFPANSVSKIEISLGVNLGVYYGILAGQCHNIIPVGDPDSASFDLKNYFNIWGGYLPVNSMINGFQLSSGNFGFKLTSLGNAYCYGPNGDCKILDCSAYLNS